jgi:hypothetical protein
MKTEQKRITIKGNGNQAPYGIGEIIDSFADTAAGLKKAMRRAAYWYNPATIQNAGGEIVDIDWNIIRDCDKGYSTSY